jgi:hypothetical protein
MKNVTNGTNGSYAARRKPVPTATLVAVIGICASYSALHALAEQTLPASRERTRAIAYLHGSALRSIRSAVCHQAG